MICVTSIIPFTAFVGAVYKTQMHHENITKEFNYKIGNVITMTIFLLKIRK
jgi:hypothetical protein